MIIDFGERGEIEMDAEQFDQTRALFGLERLDDGAEIGLVQAADQPAQRFDVGGLDRFGHAAEISPADGAVVVARQGSDFSFGHAGSRRAMFRAACSVAASSRAND